LDVESIQVVTAHVECTAAVPSPPQASYLTQKPTSTYSLAIHKQEGISKWLWKDPKLQTETRGLTDTLHGIIKQYILNSALVPFA